MEKLSGTPYSLFTGMELASGLHQGGTADIDVSRPHGKTIQM